MKVFLYDHSHLARLLLNTGPTVPPSFVRKNCSDFTEFVLVTQRARLKISHLVDSPKQREAAQHNVNQIGRIRDAAGSTPVVVAMLPDENQINHALQEKLIPPEDRPKYDFGMPQSMLTDMFREIGIPTIDMLPEFQKDPRCLYYNETHWNPDGQDLAASAIFEQLTPFLRALSR